MCFIWTRYFLKIELLICYQKRIFHSYVFLVHILEITPGQLCIIICLFVCLFLWMPSFEGYWVSLLGFSLTSGAGVDCNAKELQITTLANNKLPTS